MSVEGDSPSLQDLVAQSTEQFWSQDVIIGPGGHVEIYGPNGAVADVFKRQNISGIRILPSLIEQTSFKPNNIRGLDQVGVDEETWDELFDNLAQRIIVEELHSVPGVDEETQRRVQEEDRLDNPEV